MITFGQAFGDQGGTTLWVSGMTVAQWGTVLSPADGEVYRRVTATGGGSTDPADDTTNYRAVSYERINSVPIKNISANTNIASSVFNGVTRVTTGVIGVGVRTSILSISGRGRVGFLGFFKSEVGGGTLEMYIDGRQVTSGSIGTTNTDAALLIGAAGGHYSGSTSLSCYNALPLGNVSFRRSVQVFFTPASSPASANTALMYSVIGEA